MHNTPTTRFDRWAIVLSVACVIHCLLPPLLLASGLLLGVTPQLASPWLHPALLIVILPLSLYALGRGRKRHGRSLPLQIGTLGLALLTLAWLFGHDLPLPHAETTLTVAASMVVVAAHALNQHL